jgi:hypothetical protein
MAVAIHFFLIVQFLGLAGSFSQSSSKLVEASEFSSFAELRSLFIRSDDKSIFSSWETEGTMIVWTVTDVIPNDYGPQMLFIRPDVM